MTPGDYQESYAELDPSLYNEGPRIKKAQKAIAVLQDALGPLQSLELLDLSSSTGIMTRYYSRFFSRVVGIDIDRKAVAYAREHQSAENLRFEIQDALNLEFPSESFDVVTCTQMYEHVSDPFRMMDEIHRVLRPDGACLFSADNRLKLIDNHYGRLPLLSIVPKPVAHLYLRLLGRARYYYETHFTVWRLRHLVGRFEIVDYTERVVAEPKRFAATDMICDGTLKQRLALAVVRYAYGLFPGYIWVLRKRATGRKPRSG